MIYSWKCIWVPFLFYFFKSLLQLWFVTLMMVDAAYPEQASAIVSFYLFNFYQLVYKLFSTQTLDLFLFDQSASYWIHTNLLCAWSIMNKLLNENFFWSLLMCYLNVSPTCAIDPHLVYWYVYIISNRVIMYTCLIQ